MELSNHQKALKIAISSFNETPVGRLKNLIKIRNLIVEGDSINDTDQRNKHPAITCLVTLLNDFEEPSDKDIEMNKKGPFNGILGASNSVGINQMFFLFHSIPHVIHYIYNIGKIKNKHAQKFNINGKIFTFQNPRCLPC